MVKYIIFLTSSRCFVCFLGFVAGRCRVNLYLRVKLQHRVAIRCGYQAHISCNMSLAHKRSRY